MTGKTSKSSTPLKVKSWASKVRESITPSKKRKKGPNTATEKPAQKDETLENVKDGTNPEQVANALAKAEGHWSSTLRFPLWAKWALITLATLASMADPVTALLIAAGKKADPIEQCCDVHVSPAVCFVVFVEVNKHQPNDAKEILRLLLGFYSEGEFIQAATAAFEQVGYRSVYTLDGTYIILVELLSAPRRTRALIRVVADELNKKAAKVDPEVLEFDNTVNGFRKMLKEYHTSKRKELDILRKALKDATEAYEHDRKRYSKVEDFIQEYTQVKSGKIPVKIQAKAINTYRNKPALQEKYTLEQYLSIFKQSYGCQKIKSGLAKFRGERGYKSGIKLVKAWEKAGHIASPHVGIAENQEEPDISQADIDAADAAFGSFDEDMEE